MTDKDNDACFVFKLLELNVATQKIEAKERFDGRLSYFCSFKRLSRKCSLFTLPFSGSDDGKVIQVRKRAW